MTDPVYAPPFYAPPFYAPEEPTAAAAIAAIAEELEIFDDWMDRYQFIIELGRKLPPFPPEPWANDAHRVPGCQSQGVDGSRHAGRQAPARRHVGRRHRLRPRRPATARLFRPHPGRDASPPTRSFLRDLGLLEALSTNRGNGIAAMARAIREAAQHQMAA